MDRWLATFFHSRYRGLVLVAAVLACAASALGMRLLEIESDPDKMLRTPDAVLTELADDFHIESSDLMVMLQADTSVLTPGVLRAVHQIHTQVQQCEGITEAWSVWSVRSPRRVGRYVLPLLTTRSLEPENFATTRETLADHPLTEGHLLSEDQTATLIVARTSDKVGDAESVDALTHQMQRIVDAALEEHAPGQNVQGSVTGYPVIHGEIHRLMQRDQYVFNLVGFAAGVILGWLLLRRMAAVACVALGPLTGVCLTMGLTGYWGVPITIINSTMPLIILIVGYADAIHLVLSVREHLSQGMAPKQATVASVRRLWLPCLMTSATTAVGFGSLMISRVGTIRDFGAMTALGCMINYVAVIVVVPVAASYFGTLLLPNKTAAAEPFAGTSRWLSNWVNNHAMRITAAGCLSIVVSFWCASQLQTSNRLADSVPNEGTAYQTYRLCEDKFGGAAEMHILVRWPESLEFGTREVIDALVRTEQAVRAQSVLGPPLSVLDVLRSLPEGFHGEQLAPSQLRALRQLPPSSLERMLNEPRHSALVTARVPDMGVDELRAVMDRLEQQIASQPGGPTQITASIVGQIPTTVRTFQQLVIDLMWSVLTAALIIFGLMTLQFRSWRMGLISIVPTAFAMLGAAAILYFSGTPLQLASLVCFTICLGIAVDNTIHYLARYRMLRATHDRQPAAKAAVEEIGPALFITTVVFVVGFGTVMLSQVPVLRTFSWLACASLILAIISDTVLLPALVITLARLVQRRRAPVPAARVNPPHVPIVPVVVPPPHGPVPNTAAHFGANRSPDASPAD